MMGKAMENFWQGKRVFITGHTGFKGMWLCRMLLLAGAEVCGYALEAPTAEGRALLAKSGVLSEVLGIQGDVRDGKKLLAAMKEARPEIVFHLAAQPLVLEGYRDPVTTYETNVMGTVNILEAIRQTGSVRSFVNVTTDKVYKNNEWCWGYRENEPLDGYDPYSNSKSCSELVTHSYRQSFFDDGSVAISTARAGNVIGGGDFSADRIIPDCIRAAAAGKIIEIRNPYAIRPYQHVLEPLSAYLLIAEKQYKEISLAGAYNVGPADCDCVSNGELADIFCRCWGEGAAWKDVSGRSAGAPHEANFLRLDSAKIKSVMGWQPGWNIITAVEKTIEWAKAYYGGSDMAEIIDEQIKAFFLRA